MILSLTIDIKSHNSSRVHSDKTGKFWFDYVKDAFNFFGQAGVRGPEKFVGGSLVLAHSDLVGGAAVNYDFTNEFFDWRVALGYAAENIVLHTEL